MSTYNDSTNLARFRGLRAALESQGFTAEKVTGHEHGAEDEVVWMINADRTMRVVLDAADWTVDVHTFTANRARLLKGSMRLTGEFIDSTVAIVATLA